MCENQIAAGWGNKPHPSNYRGCRHAKELLRRKTQKAPASDPPGRMLTSRLTTSTASLVTAVRGQHQSQADPTKQQRGRRGLLR
jgi:hypothetical protein